MDEATLGTFGKPATAALERFSANNLRKHPRISPRIGLDDDITIASHDGNMQWLATLLDVSVGGIGASHDQGPIANGMYDVRFPLGFRGEAQTISARMKLVYCVRRGDLGNYRLGFQLLPSCHAGESSAPPVFAFEGRLTDTEATERHLATDTSTPDSAAMADPRQR